MLYTDDGNVLTADVETFVLISYLASQRLLVEGLTAQR